MERKAGDIKRSGKMKWVQTKVNLDEHVIVPNVDPDMDSPDRFVEDYISYLTKTPLDMSRPLWELHLLNVKTSDAEAVGIFRIHHSMGDGASLVSLLLACTRKTADPEALPTIPAKKRAGTDNSGGFWRFLLALWSMFRLIWNTVVDFFVFVATCFFLKDTESLVKGGPGVEKTTKRFVHRTVSLDDIKLIKSALNMVSFYQAYAFASFRLNLIVILLMYLDERVTFICIHEQQLLCFCHVDMSSNYG